MTRKEISISINQKLMLRLNSKIEEDFKKKYPLTDQILIVMLLSLHESKTKFHSLDGIYLALQHPSELSNENNITKTISVYDDLLELLKKKNKNISISKIIEVSISDYINHDKCFFTGRVKPLYTMIGYKNILMQKATAAAVGNMHLDTNNTLLIDACTGTGSLFLGLYSYEWGQVILNDLNPIRTNFLNTIKQEPLKLIKKILDTDLIRYANSKIKNQENFDFKKNIDDYNKKRSKYTKVDVNINMAYEMFIHECIDIKYVKSHDSILSNVLQFLPAHLKLQKVKIAQKDCLSYLKNDTANKLILLDIPYIGSEKQCAIEGYDYNKFHKVISTHLYKADYKFLYYCRSSAPKSDLNKSLLNEECIKEKLKNENIMKMKLGEHFFDKGFYFQKIALNEDMELLISNCNYDSSNQFKWTDFHQDLL